MPGWSVPGYAVEDLVGTGATGEVWRARETATGEIVAVKLLRVAGGSDAAERLRAGLARLAGVRHPHLVRPRAVLPVADGMAVISDFIAGGNLASVLSERGSLAAGEIVTVGVPLASALAALHEHGFEHGAVTPTNVLFTAAGRPLLSDFGQAAVRDPVRLGPPDDVQALGALLAGALEEGAPAVLRECVDRAMVADPAERLTAAELARALRAAGPSAPVRLGRTPARGDAAAVRLRGSALGHDAAPARPPPRRVARSTLALLAGVPLALAAAVLVGRTWAAADRPGRPPPLQPATVTSPSPGRVAARAPGPVIWSSVMATLDDRRNAALATLDANALADVYAAGSAPLAADAAAIRQLAAADVRVEDLRLEIRSVQALRRTPAGITVRIVDQLPAYQIVDAHGRVLERRPGRGPLSWLVQLVPAGDGWRIATVARG